MPDICKLLQEPLNPQAIKQRDQGNIKLSYLESWYVIQEANRIFGCLGWNRETISLDLVQAEQKGDKGLWYVSYISKSRVTILDNLNIIREGTGFGQGIDRDLGKAHESAIKEAESDSMKRAFMTFGNPLGLALYDKEQRGVAKPVDQETARRLMVDKCKDLWFNSLAGDKEQFVRLKAILQPKGIDAFTFLLEAESQVQNAWEILKLAEEIKK
jgi:DNA repair and recombination protein RAD52